MFQQLNNLFSICKWKFSSINLQKVKINRRKYARILYQVYSAQEFYCAMMSIIRSTKQWNCKLIVDHGIFDATIKTKTVTTFSYLIGLFSFVRLIIFTSTNRNAAPLYIFSFISIEIKCVFVDSFFLYVVYKIN